jgi:hypothetical protein
LPSYTDDADRLVQLSLPQAARDYARQNANSHGAYQEFCRSVGEGINGRFVAMCQSSAYDVENDRDHGERPCPLFEAFKRAN